MDIWKPLETWITHCIFLLCLVNAEEFCVVLFSIADTSLLIAIWGFPSRVSEYCSLCFLDSLQQNCPLEKKSLITSITSLLLHYQSFLHLEITFSLYGCTGFFFKYSSSPSSLTISTKDISEGCMNTHVLTLYTNGVRVWECKCLCTHGCLNIQYGALCTE